MKTNYHTHTTRCMHAVGNDEDYVRSAIKGGFQELGFSDHSPWKYHTDFVSDSRGEGSEPDPDLPSGKDHTDGGQNSDHQ